MELPVLTATMGRPRIPLLSMDLNDLHLAVVIAREGNMAAASQVLGLSQPTLSKAVARLERETKVRLFERVARGMRPTELGRAFLARAQQLDIAAADLHAQMRDLRQSRAGELRFGVGLGLPDHWIMPAVRALADAGVRVHLSGGMPDALLPRVALGELAFCLSGMSAAPGRLQQARAAGEADDASASAVPGGNLAWEPLRPDPILPLAPVGHVLAQGRRRPSWAQLAAARWVVPGVGTPTHAEFLRNFDAQGQQPQWLLISQSSQRELALAESLDALVLGARSRLQDPAVCARFVPVTPPGGWSSTRQAALVYRAGGYLSPAAERAMGLLREAVRAS